MEQITQAELEDLLKKHKLFIDGYRGGARCVLKFMDLSNLNFKSANLRDADFTGSRMNGVNLSATSCVNTSFFGCDMHHANLSKAVFKRADLRGAQIISADLTEADFTNADLRQGVIFNYQGNEEYANVDWQNRGHTVMSGSIVRDTNMTNVMAQGVNFSEANLTGVIIKHANLRDANLEGANLSAADFTGCNLNGSKSAGAVVENTVFYNVDADNSDLKKTVAEQNKKQTLASAGLSLGKLLESHMRWVETAGAEGEQMILEEFDLSKEKALKSEKLTAVIAKKCRFTGLNMEGSMMQASYLDQTDFKDCNMRNTDFRGSSCQGAFFTRANLIGADFSALIFKKPDGSSILQKANLSDASMAYVDMDGANFSNVIFKNADLSYASLVGANLSNADLSGADLSKADLRDANLDGANIEGAILLGTIHEKRKVASK